MAHRDGATALVIAIINANYDFAAILIDAGADPNIVDKEAGMGPLYTAVDMRHLAVGHDINAANDSGDTALHLAVAGRGRPRSFAS